MMNTQGKIILFPCPVVDGKIKSLSAEAIHLLHQTKYFIVERAKTARHFLKASGHPTPIQEIVIHEMTTDKTENTDFMQVIFSGVDVGIISEAGCPGIADPGAETVEWGHKNNIQIVPLVGPSSILLALMSSGLNGQNFAFNGYLSNKKPELIQELKALEAKVSKSSQTQIFMETPYRNGFILETCLQTLNENTRLCVACDINSPTESIIQKRIRHWKNTDFSVYHKRPSIFLIG